MMMKISSSRDYEGREEQESLRYKFIVMVGEHLFTVKCQHIFHVRDTRN